MHMIEIERLDFGKFLRRRDVELDRFALGRAKEIAGWIARACIAVESERIEIIER